MLAKIETPRIQRRIVLIDKFKSFQLPASFEATFYCLKSHSSFRDVIPVLMAARVEIPLFVSENEQEEVVLMRERCEPGISKLGDIKVLLLVPKII